MAKGAKLVFSDIRKHIEQGGSEIPVQVDGHTMGTLLEVSDRQRKLLLAGGALNLAKRELRGAGQ
jgi:aconitate hydratase